MRVRFLQRTVYDTNGPGKGPVYAKDSVHDLSQDEAERWFRRGMAVEAPPEPEPVPAPESAPEPELEPAPAAEATPAPVAAPIIRGRRAGA